MKTLTIYGSGCANCKRTEAIINTVIVTHHITDVQIAKVTSMQEIVAAGVMSTPAVALDGAMLSIGRIPRSEEIYQWLTQE